MFKSINTHQRIKVLTLIEIKKSVLKPLKHAFKIFFLNKKWNRTKIQIID